MAPKTRLDMDEIARGLGGVRWGKVVARTGHFGASDLAADIGARFRAPSRAGRGTRLAPGTLRRRKNG